MSFDYGVYATTWRRRRLETDSSRRIDHTLEDWFVGGLSSGSDCLRFLEQFWQSPIARRTSRADFRRAKRPGCHSSSEDRFHPRLPQRPRLRYTAEHCYRQDSRRRATDERPVSGRPSRSRRNLAGRDRPSPIPGPADAVRGTVGARPGSAGERAPRSTAFHSARPAEFNSKATVRYASIPCAPARRHR